MRTAAGFSKADLTSVRGKILNSSNPSLSQHSRGTRSAIKIQDSKNVFDMNHHKRSLSKQGLKQLPGQRHDALKQFAIDQLSLLSEIQQKEDAEERRRESTFDQNSNFMEGVNRSQQDKMRSNILKNLKKTHANSKSQGGAKSLLLRNKSLINEDYQLTSVSPQGPINPIMQIKQEKEVAQQKALQRPYNINIQKQFLVRQIRDRLRKEFQNMYRNAENAYNTLDFTGLGYIERDVFMNCIVVKDRIPWSQEQINVYCSEFNLFQNAQRGMDFDTFKKNFFPHTYLAQDPADDADDKVAKKNRDNLSDPSKREETQAMIEERLKKLENKLKLKFQNCYHSVRKAFLALDTDYDGYITVEDILKYFGNETELNYNDLLKLMIDHDASKQGRIDYSDFSKWFGNAIHMSSGFYFRHDSKKNPDFDLQLERDKKNKEDDRHKAAQSLLTGDLEFMILEKMKIQWKTIRKAFMDLNHEKTGTISKTEFKFFLNYWGIEMSEAQFEQIFSKFDLDGDGKISYKDFQLSIGSDMFPQEGLYFRQEKKQSDNKCVVRPVVFKVNCCQHPDCWQPVANGMNYCDVHQKMHSDESAQLFSKIFKQIGNRWKQFIEEIKLRADKDDQRQILFSDFNSILIKLGYKLTEKDKYLLLKALPGKASGDGGQRLNVSRIYDQKYTNILDKMYYNFDTDKFVDNALTDEMGYLGKSEFYREKFKLTPIDEDEFLQIIFKGKKLREIMLMVKSIDSQRNGYVTSYELDDIIKIQHPEDLQKRDLKPIISKFESLQNKILIDYKKFRDWVLIGLSQIQERENLIDHVAKNKRLSEQISQLETQINHHKKSEIAISNQIDEKLSRASSKLNQNDQDDIKSNKYIKLSQQKNIHNDAKSWQFGQRASSCINGFKPSPKESMSNIPKKNLFTAKKLSNLDDSVNLSRAGDLRSNYQNIDNQQDNIRAKSMLEEQNENAQSIGSKYINVSKLVTNNKKQFDSTYDRTNGRAVTAIRTRNDEASRQGTQIAVNQSTQIKNERLRNIARQRSNTGLDRADSISELSQQNYFNPHLVSTDDNLLRKIVEFSLDYDIEDRNAQMNSTHEMNQKNTSLTREAKSKTQLNFVTAAKLDEEIGQNTFLTPQRFVHKKISKNDEQIITNKLAYEWKNIFRQLTVDSEGSNQVSIYTFDKACLKVGVTLTKEELKKINFLFGETNNQRGTISDTDMINFHDISYQLGLHRGSYNYLNQSISSNRAKSMHKLQQLYQSIDPVEELDENADEAEAKPAQQHRSRPKSSHNTFHKKSKSYIMRNNSIKHNKTFLKTRQLSNQMLQDSNNQQLNMTANQEEDMIEHLGQNIKTQESSIFKNNTFNKVPFNSRAHNPQQNYPAKNQIRRQKLRNDMMQNIQAHQNNNQIRPESVEKQSVKASQQGFHSSTAFGTTSHGQRIKSGAFGERKTSNGPMTFADPESENQHQQVNSDLKIRTRPKTSENRFLRKPQEQQQLAKWSLADQRETISNVLRAKGNLQKLRDLVQIHLKKKDLQNQIILNAQTMQESDKTIIAVNSFKQCLQALNVDINDQLLQQFIVKGEVKLRKENDSKSVMNGFNEFDDKKSSRSALSGVKSIKSFKSMNQTQSKIMAVISANGSKTLGVDVQQFINTYA